MGWFRDKVAQLSGRDEAERAFEAQETATQAFVDRQPSGAMFAAGGAIEWGHPAARQAEMEAGS